MAISWKWMLLGVLTASLVLAVIFLAGGPAEVGATPTNLPPVSYEELTRIIGPVAI